MTTPKPSEILRPLLDERGNVKGDSDTYRDKLFGIIDRLDAEQRRLAAKVDGLQTASEWPKWTAGKGTVWRWAGLGVVGEYWCVPPGELHGHQDSATYESKRVNGERDITHAEAIALIPKIAETYPLPVKPDPTTNAPAPTNDLEAALRKMPGVGPKLAELADGECLMGVGDGRGNLFVYGSHEVIVAVRNIANDLDSARAECERLRGLIREFTESMTKTLGDGLPKGAVR